MRDANEPHGAGEHLNADVVLALLVANDAAHRAYAPVAAAFELHADDLADPYPLRGGRGNERAVAAVAHVLDDPALGAAHAEVQGVRFVLLELVEKLRVPRYYGNARR